MFDAFRTQSALLHTEAKMVPDGEGGTRLTQVAVPCTVAEAERQQLREQAARVPGLEATVSNYERLIAASIPMIFGLGPALKILLAENFEEPTTTDDGTAIKLESLQFVVILRPFHEQIVVRAVGCDVPEQTFKIVDGRIGQGSQTAMLGLIDRIRRARATGVDPVVGAIELVDMVKETADTV